MISIEDTSTIKTGLHCPYCNGEKGVLINKIVSKKYSFQLPAYGLKWVLSVLYLSFIHILVNGMKLWEFTKELKTLTYVFCPECGNSFPMQPSEDVEKTVEVPHLKRNMDKKMLSGLCAGIADYTGISLGWIRFMTILYGLTVIGSVLYTIIAACTSYDNKPERLYRNKEKKAITGLCAGIADYTGISLAWIRFLMVMSGFTVIGLIGYLLLSAYIPFNTDSNRD